MTHRCNVVPVDRACAVMMAVLVVPCALGGTTGHAALPLCETTCTSSTKCTTSCSDGGVNMTCAEFGVCGTPN